MTKEELAGKRARLWRIFGLAGAALFAVLSVSALFLPLPEYLDGAADERYSCVWEDGSRTEESYFAAYSGLTGATENEISVEGAGGHGVIAPTDEYRRAYAVLSEGNLGELYALDPLVSRLEQAALWRAFGNRVWYDSGYFVWDGSRIAVSKSVKRDVFVLLNGKVSAQTLKSTGAKKLEIRSSAEITASAFAGTQIEEVTAEAPYVSDGGALYLKVAGETRLVAGIPAVRSLTVSGNEWADEGALRACKNIEELTVPFVGSTGYIHTSEYAGEFAWLFLENGDYLVPASLKKVTVTGGTLAPFAFYCCDRVEEISACGLSATEIAREAFVNCTGWKRIHSPRADVLLPGTYERTLLPCGCTLFERIEENGREIF